MAALSIERQKILEQYGKEIRAPHIEKLKEIKSVLVTIFGESFHQITQNSVFHENDDSIAVNCYMKELKLRIHKIHYTITIHFPEFVISNTDKKSHLIKDLYVQFYLTGDLKLTKSIDTRITSCFLTGLRTTFTPEEYNSNYAHSHLLGIHLYFAKFCTGNGTPINQIISKLSTGYKKVDFNIFLQTIKIYVKHESLDGVPHKYISNIGTQSSALPVINIDPDKIKKLFSILFQIFIVDYKLLNYTLSDSSIDAIITPEFDTKIAETIRVNYQLPVFKEVFRDISLSDITPFKMSDGRYSIAASPVSTQNYSTDPLFDFKGQPKLLYVGYTNTTTESGVINTRYTHPTIIESLRREFSKVLTISAIKLQNPGW